MGSCRRRLNSDALERRFVIAEDRPQTYANDMFGILGDKAVGTSMASFAENVVGDDYPNHKWADHMMSVAMPNVGDNGLGGCGIPGGECDPGIEYVKQTNA